MLFWGKLFFEMFLFQNFKTFSAHNNFFRKNISKKKAKREKNNGATGICEDPLRNKKSLTGSIYCLIFSFHPQNFLRSFKRGGECFLNEKYKNAKKRGSITVFVYFNTPPLELKKKFSDGSPRFEFEWVISGQIFKIDLALKSRFTRENLRFSKTFQTG